jgi:L-aminopeptidase/D-esterase-like protein
VQRHVDWYPYCDESSDDALAPATRDGSIIIVVATDAPLLPHQLRRLAKRPSLGLGRLGSISGDGSGDIFIAFSTANRGLINENQPGEVMMYPNNGLSDVFTATVQATEEAIVNAMVAAETVIGAAGLQVEAISEEQLRTIFLNE